MLPNQIVNFLTFFDAYCYNSGSSKLSKNIKVVHSVYFIHVLMVIFLTIFGIHLILEYYPLLGLTEAFTELLQYSTPLCTYWLILVDSIVYQKSHQDFWYILLRIHKQFYGQFDCNFYGYFIKIVEFFTVTISISVLYAVLNPVVDSNINIMYSILIKICQIRIFYYLFCLEIVQYQLKAIENEMKFLQNIQSRRCHLPCSSKSPKFVCFAIQRLKWFREYFSSIHKMVDILSKVFVCSHMVAILFCFYMPLTDFNWFYIHFDECSRVYRFGKGFFFIYPLSMCNY